MSVYAIGQLTIHNRDWMPEYTQKIGALFEKHGGKIIAKSAPEALEGDAELPNISLIIEFPSTEAAKAWYDDPENQKLVALRQTGSDFNLQLIESAN
ncbi:MAG: DUF1330 domain-containing protein [Gammaproteobacteria bacterium]|nr:DUF1330 domain-containing protein [Gammaproteobacteria bacterium]